jgi:hypothetical protein
MASSIADAFGVLEVWALNRCVDTMKAGSSPGLIDGSPVSLNFSSPLRAGNQNLHAQGGVFTYPTIQHSGALRPADEIISAMAEKNPGWARPVMHRFRLTQFQAHRLLWLLSFEPVTGATLFPGYSGVVRDVRDRRISPTGE